MSMGQSFHKTATDSAIKEIRVYCFSHTDAPHSYLGAFCISRLNMANHPKPSAKNEKGDFAKFENFMKRLVAVPHSEIKAKLEAEKRSKKRTRASRASSASD